METGRYFLYDVPGGVTDGAIMQSLGEVINYREGIQSVQWVKPATLTEGGVVQLSLDSKAVGLIKARVELLYVGSKQVVFVDKQELATKTTSTIDGDLLQLVTQEMPTATFGKLVQKLKMTKFVNDDGYDCWRVEGSFSDMKAFEIGMQKVLFGDRNAVSQASSTGKKAKAKQSRRKKAPVLSVDRSPDEETVRSDDVEGKPDNANVPSVQWSAKTSPTSNWKTDKLSFAANNSLPMHIEFCIGDLVAQAGVDAIVVPTDVQLNPDASVESLRVVSAMKDGVYDKFRQDKLEELGGFVPMSTAVAMENVDLLAHAPLARNIIFVIEPRESSSDVSTAIKKISQCYDSIFRMAEMKRFVTLACPPLGVETGVDAPFAAGAAVAAILDASYQWMPCLTEFMDVLRFICPSESVKNDFVLIFMMRFGKDGIKPEIRTQPQLTGSRSSKKKGKGASQKKVAAMEMCSICWGQLGSELPTKRLDGCGHDFHSPCIEKWQEQKGNCPVCAMNGKAGLD